MPRKPRFFLPNVPVHVVQRGHSRENVFFDNEDRDEYLGWLGEAAEHSSCAIHAYVLMDNHIHILATPVDAEGIGLMMQYVGRRYVPYINHKYDKSGSIWEGRYRASLIQEDDYLLTSMRYMELNPVRADMVKSPAHYRWSSYRGNAQCKNDTVLTPHELYLKLGDTEENRCLAYKALFKTRVDDDGLTAITDAWRTGTPLGDEYFIELVEQTLHVKVGQSKRGRPRKIRDDSDGDSSEK